MPSFTSRFTQALSLAQRFGSVLSGATPAVALPVAPLAPPQANQNAELARAIRSIEALFGRVSYDAGPSWTRFSSYPATDLSPDKIVTAQREADAGYPLRWAEMDEQVRERDAHLGGIALTRAQDVAGKAVRVSRVGDDDLASSLKSLCDEVVFSINSLDDAFESLLLGNAPGWSSSEIVYVEDDVSFAGPDGRRIGPIPLIVPRRLETIHPKHFTFDLRTDEPYLWLGGDRQSLPRGKFIFHRGEGSSAITARRGYMRSCVWLSAAKSWSFSDWIVFIHKYGIPTTALFYDGSVAQYDQHKRVFEDILKALGDGRSAIIPEGNRVEPIQSPVGGRATDPHSAMCDACDASMSIRVLGATLTARIGNVGSFAATAEHAQVKYGREEADARKLCSTLRRDVLAPFIDLNLLTLANALKRRPDEIRRRVPAMRFRIDRETTASERAGIVSRAVNEWGLEVDEEQVRDEFNLDAVRPGSRPLPGKPQQVASGGAVVGTVDAARDGAVAPKPEPKST
jgi:phage gp29-like protein